MAEIPDIHSKRKAEIQPYEFPEDVLTGDAMFEKARAHLTEYCEAFNIDPSVIERVVHAAEEWSQVEVGEPILKLAQVMYADQTTRRTATDGGGIVHSPLYLTTGDYPRFAIDVKRLNHKGRREIRAVTMPVEELAWTYHKSPQLSDVFAGEQAVRARLAAVGRSLQSEHSEVGDTYRTLQFLRGLRDAHIPMGYLDLSDEARAELCARIVELMVGNDEPYVQRGSLEALIYLANITTIKEFEALLDSIEDQFASVMPLRLYQSAATAIAALEGMQDYRFVNPAILKKAGGIEVNNAVKHASAVADMYERRAAQEFGRQQPDAPLVIPDVTVTEVPPVRNLMFFRTANWRFADVKQDVAHIRALAASGYKVSEMIDRGDVNDNTLMRFAIDNLSRYVSGVDDPVARAEAFLAMEYLFELETPIHRDDFYWLMEGRFALSLPFKGNLHLDAHIRVADTMSRLMPNPPQAPDGTPYTGDARIAAMLGRLYRRRAFQLLRKQLVLREAEPTEEET